MLYHRKKEKLITEAYQKNNQDSTQNSQTTHSTHKNKLTLRNKKKSLAALIATKDPNTQKFQQKITTIQKHNKKHAQNYKPNIRIQHSRKNTDVKQQGEQKKTSIESLTKSTSSLNSKKQIKNNLGQGSKKQFKLIYQLKKNKNEKKGSNKESQIQSRQTLSFITTQSNFKGSKVSKFSDNEDQSGRPIVSSKRKINLEERIKKLKSQHQKKSNAKNDIQLGKQQLKQQKQETPITTNSFNQFHRQNTKNQSSRSNSKKKSSLKQTKQSTLNIKKDILRKSNLTSQISTKNIKISSLEEVSTYKPNEESFQIHIDSKITKKLSEPIPVQTQSFLPEQSYHKNKLSSIREEKLQDTISRSIKASIRESIQTSNNKSLSGTSLNLSINSVVNRSNKRKHSFNLLQISESRQSKLRNSIQSILSINSNCRPTINLKHFTSAKDQKFNILDTDQSDFQQNLTTMDRLNFHLDILHTLSNFVYNSTQISTDAEEWEELNFLVYKKFYIQRLKVAHFLKKYPMKNPFCIYNASIQTKQILKLLKEQEIREKKKVIQTQNQQINKNLHYFYKQFEPQKYGQKINLFEYDNFSHWIYQQLWSEFVLVEHNPDYSDEQIYERMCRILQMGFLISELNGNYVTPFKEAEQAVQRSQCQTYVQDNKCVYQKLVLKR